MSNNAPVNVKLQVPTVFLANWSSEASEWENINRRIGGNPDFYPLTIKAAYVIGLIHDLCQSVSILLSSKVNRDITYLPAYGLFASGIDLLGRCLQGNSTTNPGNDLMNGFKWLVSSSFTTVSDAHILTTTSLGDYPINRLVGMRHFSAHGQATPRPPHSIDYELLGKMPALLADGLERYWYQLQQSDDLCNNLAKANVIPFRNWPVEKSWILFEKDQQGKSYSVYVIFNRFNWV
jgi:hypothetical protein